MNLIDYFKEKPELITKLRAITAEQKDLKLDARLRALVELRVSQINGCVYCTDLHARRRGHWAKISSVWTRYRSSVNRR